MSQTTDRRPRVVIIGGGFGGLYAARALRGVPVDITLIDRRNHHVFQPLLYQVATASLSPGDIASPIRSILAKQKNVEVFMAEVTDIDVAGKRVILNDGDIAYDFLIVASGATHAYFSHPEWEQFAPGLKTLDDATEIRRRFLVAFEAAEREDDAAAIRRLLTFVIIGGGPTGVEMAGALAEIARNALPGEFRHIDTTTARILLLEGGPRILPSYTPDLSEKARRQLVKLGVEVRTDALVTGIDEDFVSVGDDRISASNVFWAAGVAASPLGARLGAPIDRAGRVCVEHDCSIPGHPEVFVVGDLAFFDDRGNVVPGVAQGAMQMGRHAAHQIRGDLRGQPRAEFHYFDKGLLATIGRAAAVAQIWKLHLSGLLAWFVWVVVHITYLIGFRNRLIVMIDWAWAYIAYHRGVRLITGNQNSAVMRARIAAEMAVHGDVPPELGASEKWQPPASPAAAVAVERNG